MEKPKEMSTSLQDYLKSLRKELKTAQADFWKEIRSAEHTFHKDMVAAMRDYEKVEYSNKRIPGALGTASKNFNDKYNTAYQIFGSTTRQTLERFKKRIEDLIGA